MTPAIVVVAYNRPESLQRLLKSLAMGRYETGRKITLAISIDKSENQNVYSAAHEFSWPFGEKRIISHKSHLGLKEHILKCGDLTKEYGSLILLEDDLFVSPFFYKYASEALEFYKRDEKISGISLYNYHFNESASRPFIPLHDGNDVYFIQTASSSGQAWTSNQWDFFRNWFAENPFINTSDFLPQNVHCWPDSSWKKHFIKYMVFNDKYFVYPRTSYTTNCGDAGTHHRKVVSIHQVPILMKEKEIQFVPFKNSLAVYDAFFEIRPESASVFNKELLEYDVEFDLYGTKDLSKVNKEYALTSKPCVNSLATYSNQLKPHELGVLLKMRGSGIRLSRTSDVENKKMNLDQFYLNYLYDFPSANIKNSLAFILSKIIRVFRSFIGFEKLRGAESQAKEI